MSKSCKVGLGQLKTS